jgi:Xaa-Pro dipeptidase
MLSRRRFLLTAATTAPALALNTPHLYSQVQPPCSQDQLPTSAELPAPILAVKNRSHEAVPISTAERQRRTDRARELMQQHKVAALTVTGGTTLQYFLGVSPTESAERLFAWTLPAVGAPFIVCPAFEESRMHEVLSTSPNGASTRIYTWNEDDDPYALLAKSLQAATSSSSLPLAIDERVQFVFANRIAQAVAPRQVTSAIPIVSGCRSIKTPAELALMQLANDITLSVYKAVYESCSPGMTNRHFTSLIDAAYARCGVHGEASCQVGAFSAQPYGSPTPQVIAENQIILIDDGCFVQDYQSDISRSFVYGKATDRQKRIFDIVHHAQAAALAAARPGVEMQAVDAAARNVITAAGFGPGYKYFTHRVGHGIGMDMNEWPYLVRGGTQTLVPNMTFSVEPGIYLPNDPEPFGIRLEDDMHITEDGARLFTPQSPSLEHPFANA